MPTLGIGADDLATVVVTHIHLDHAGGVGDIAEMFPEAEVVVHELGARHLADPSRLMASARMVYGDELDALFGALAPTPADRIRTVEQTGVVDLGGGRRLESHYSPGHAKHHVGLVDSVSGDLYVGDAAGIYIPETGDQRPATPPPDFNLGIALESLRMFAALRPTRLLFSHYGPVAAVDEALERSAEEIQLWVEETRQARRAGLDLDHAVAMVAERTRERYAVFAPDADPELAAKYDRIAGAPSNVVRHHGLAGQDRRHSRLRHGFLTSSYGHGSRASLGKPSWAPVSTATPARSSLQREPELGRDLVHRAIAGNRRRAAFLAVAEPKVIRRLSGP